MHVLIKLYEGTQKNSYVISSFPINISHNSTAYA